MSPRAGWLLVLAMIAAAATWRCSVVLADPSFALADDSGLFWSECAMQYRHARMVAETGALPEIDLRAEAPEGLQVRRHLTVVPEVVEGWVYRAAIPATVPFHVFLALFLCVVSSFSAAAVYGLARATTGSVPGALLAAGFLLTSSAAASSVLTHQVLKEDFALPFYFGHCACLVSAWRHDSRAHGLWSGALLFVALASWHMVPSVLLVELAALSVLVLLGAPSRPLARALQPVAGFTLLAAVSLPTLRDQGFLMSMPSLALVGATLAATLAGRVPTRLHRLGLWLVPLSVSFVWGRLNQQEFSHTYALLFAKLRFLGEAPADPTRISWEAAVMWTSSFLSPTWASFTTFFAPLALAAVAGLGLALLRVRQWTAVEWFQVLLTLAFAVLYLLIERMDCVLAFFLALQTANLVPRAEDAPADGAPSRQWSARRLASALAGVGLLLFGTWWLASSRLWGVSPPPGPLLELIKAVRHQVPDDAPVLAVFQLSPSILAFTERPIVLQSKFETSTIRAKVRRFEEALFEDEEAFWAYCRERGARYFVDTPELVVFATRESVRYRVHRLGSLEGTAALALHAHPEALRHFQVVWSNSGYTLYRVLDPGQVPDGNHRDYARATDPAVVEVPERLQ